MSVGGPFGASTAGTFGSGGGYPGIADDGTTVSIDVERHRIRSLNTAQTGPVVLAAGLTSNWDAFSGGTPTMVVIVTPDTTDSIIDGIKADGSGTPPVNGALLVLIHSSINHGRLIFRTQEGSVSSAGNQIRINSESNVSLNGCSMGHRQSAMLVYSSYDSCWHLLGGVDGTFRKLSFSGSITDVALAAIQNDYTPTGIQWTSVLRLAPSGATTALSGLLGQSDGDFRVITAFGAGITLLHNSTIAPNASIAGNRFLLPSGTNVTLPNFGTVTLRYDGSNTAWMLHSKNF